MPLTNRNIQILEWERLAADPLNHPLEAITACQQRLAAHGPTQRCVLMINQTVRTLLKFNNFSVAKRYSLRPVNVRDAARNLKAALAAAVQLKKAQNEVEEAPPIELLKPGVITTFSDDGSRWTLQNGKAVKIQEAEAKHDENLARGI